MDKNLVKDDLVLFGHPAEHYDDSGIFHPPLQLLEISVCGDPDQIEAIGRFFLECASDMRTNGNEAFSHVHFRDTHHKPDIVVCPPENFAALFNMRVDGRDELTLARTCKVSIPTIKRWMAGATSPHPIARPAILAALDAPAKQNP